jgi:hypothetical protein
MGGHELGMEMGCRTKLPTVQRSRICRLCPSDTIKDEVHILRVCLGLKKIRDARQDLILALLALPRNELKTDIRKVKRSDPNLWSYLWHPQEPSVIRLFAPYLRLCLETTYETKCRYMPVRTWNSKQLAPGQ